MDSTHPNDTAPAEIDVGNSDPRVLMNLCAVEASARLRDRRGAALLVVLMAIVATSVMLTAILTSGTTELVLSHAHQDATRDLYVAQGGLEAYVAQMGDQLAPTPEGGVVFQALGAPVSDQAVITVRQLASIPAEKPHWPNNLIFSVESRPVRGGRTVSAMAHVLSTKLTLTNDVDAAVVSGSDVEVSGNTTLSNGSDSPFCAAADSSQYALQVDGENTVRLGRNVTVKGDTGTVEGDEYDYVTQMLGTSFHNLVANAQIKFGRGQFSGNTTVTSLATGTTANVANLSNPQLTPYNWGCPKDLLAGSNTACEADTDTVHLPIVAIDASNSDGTWGTVTVNLAHGQGMLIVYNGNLRIQGNLIYKGMILVEGGFTVTASGGGAQAPKIEGAIIGLGQGGAQSVVELEETDNTISGSPTVRYNRCAIDTVVKAVNESTSFQRHTPPTSAWSEVLR